MSMTNEELAMRIQAGDSACVERLWNNIHKLMHRIAGSIYKQRQERCTAAGVTQDDILQECFFVMLRAVDAYNPDAGYAFNSYIKYHLKNVINGLLGFRTAGQRYAPLNTCTSLEVDIAGEGDEGLRLEDMLEDPEGAEPFEAVEQSLMYEELYKAVNALPDQKRQIILYHFLRDIPLKDCAQLLGMHTIGNAFRIKQEALRALRQDPRLWSMAEYYSSGLKHTSLAFFRDTGTSSVEAAAIKHLDEGAYT